MLADLLLQDIEEDPDDGKGAKIRKGTAPDRIVSTTDPEMRHGRKSKSNRFDGHKASVAVDADSGVILATDVIPGNAHDSQGAGDLVKQAAKVTGSDVEKVLGDTAYGTSAAREDIQKAAKDADIIAKVPPRRGCASWTSAVGCRLLSAWLRPKSAWPWPATGRRPPARVNQSGMAAAPIRQPSLQTARIGSLPLAENCACSR